MDGASTDAGDEDEAALVALTHLRQYGLRHADRADGVVGVEALDLVQRARLDRGGEDGTGVGDQGVDFPGVLDGCIDAGLVGHIETQALGDLETVERAGVARRRDDAVAALGELGGGCTADALGGASDED